MESFHPLSGICVSICEDKIINTYMYVRQIDTSAETAGLRQCMRCSSTVRRARATTLAGTVCRAVAVYVQPDICFWNISAFAVENLNKMAKIAVFLRQ